MKRDVTELEHRQFDLCVVGAGIQGACLAWEATLSGLRVALIDAQDFGAMTSHNSYKLIHGGFRYLQQFDLPRIRQSMREQAFWLRNAPGFVRPLQFVMPTYGHTLRGPEALTAALWAYRALAWAFSPHHKALLPRGHVYSRHKLSQLIPGFSAPKVNGAATWFDGQMQESDRLLVRIVQHAANDGLVACNYVRAHELLNASNTVHGVGAVDETTGREFAINARAVAVCAGPQTYRFLHQCGVTGVPEDLPWIKGINVTVSRRLFDYALALETRAPESSVTPANRLMFLTPWGESTIIGTTHAPYLENPAGWEVSQTEITMLLDQIKAAYPAADFSLDDVQYCYAGYTPSESTEGSISRSRTDTFISHVDDGYRGLYSVVGVKFTTARDVAEKTVERILRDLGSDPRLPRAERPPLFAPGEYREFGQQQHTLTDRTRNAVRDEMGVHLDDVILRRTSLLARGQLTEEAASAVADFMAADLGWAAPQREVEWTRLLAAMASHHATFSKSSTTVHAVAS